MGKIKKKKPVRAGILLQAVIWVLFVSSAHAQSEKTVACTMEARVCPDGSAVGRTGPNCEFAPCPGEIVPQNGTPVKVRNLEVPQELRLRDGFDYSKYYGVLQSQGELNALWDQLYNAYDDMGEFHRWLPWVKGNVPPAPEVDFEAHSVLWYANDGSHASFVSNIEAAEFPEKIVVKVTAFHSDFGSTELNLWTIPRTDKDIVFEESHEYEGGLGP